MQISSIYDTAPQPWKDRLAGLLQFIRLHGERRITAQGYKAMSRFTPDLLGVSGSSLLTATVRGQNGRELAGVSFVSDYGREACLIAVHPLYRNRHLGTSLLTAHLRQIGHLECHVDCDNTASQKMCFNAGLVAVSLVNGATGKPTLLFRSPPGAGSLTILPPKEGELLCQNPS